jgi:hypothetical protein
MITLSGTFKACEPGDQTKSMITLSGTFKACESGDQTKSMITLSGTFKACVGPQAFTTENTMVDGEEGQADRGPVLALGRWTRS